MHAVVIAFYYRMMTIAILGFVSASVVPPKSLERYAPKNDNFTFKSRKRKRLNSKATPQVFAEVSYERKATVH